MGKVLIFRVPPLHATIEDHLDWCERNNVEGARLHMGPDGSIRGGGLVNASRDNEGRMAQALRAGRKALGRLESLCARLSFVARLWL